MKVLWRFYPPLTPASIVSKLQGRPLRLTVLEAPMRAIELSQNDFEIMPDARLPTRRRRWALGLTVSITAAFLTGLLGLALGAISLLHLIPAESRSSIYGTVLLIVTFPLLILAGHCMDKIDERTTKR